MGRYDTMAPALFQNRRMTWEGIFRGTARILWGLFKKMIIASRIAVIVGSEGGFSPEEAAKAQAAGMCMTGLGKRILRTETASGFVLSCLIYALEL